MILFKRNKIMLNGQLNLTLKKICSIMGVKVPPALKHMANQVNNDVVMTTKRAKPGSIYFMMFGDDVDLKKNLNLAVKRGASVIFVDKKMFEKSKIKKNKYPVILLDNRLEQVGKFFSAVRKSYDIKTVAVTGTVGKTTTNQFLTAIVKSSYNAFCSTGNRNSYMSTANHIINKLNNDLEVYVQEVGAASPHSVEKSARMLAPDVFVLLNVNNHHINKYGTFEALFTDKTSIDRFMSDDGIVIANYDDDNIAKHDFIHKVISFGITTDRDVDYRAVNIEEKNEFLEFDVLHDDTSTHIRIKILGKHNVYNALAAYVAGIVLGVQKENIVSSFLKYRSSGIRQNFQEVGNYKLYVDCYNAAMPSIIADFKALENFKLKEGERKIVVLGGENKIGEQIREKHYEFGKTLSQYDVDEIICFGPKSDDLEVLNYYGDSEGIYLGLKDAGFPKVSFISDMDDLVNKIKTMRKPGDMFLFKGVLWIDMPVAIDKAFGTSFSYNYEYYVKKAESVEDDLFNARDIPMAGDIEITDLKAETEDVIIPEDIDHKPVFRIGNKAFFNNSVLKNVCFGQSLQNIGKQSFSRCNALERITIPGNIKIIEQEAFAGSMSLKEVIIKEGVEHIDTRVFANCNNLCSVIIPDSVARIEEDAFSGCPNLTIRSSKTSCAYKYAINNKLPVESL